MSNDPNKTERQDEGLFLPQIKNNLLAAQYLCVWKQSVYDYQAGIGTTAKGWDDPKVKGNRCWNCRGYDTQCDIYTPL